MSLRDKTRQQNLDYLVRYFEDGELQVRSRKFFVLTEWNIEVGGTYTVQFNGKNDLAMAEVIAVGTYSEMNDKMHELKKTSEISATPPAKKRHISNKENMQKTTPKLKTKTTKTKKYYKAAGLSEDEMKKRMQKCSRHRAKYVPPGTPEHFWSIGFPDTPECIERGYMRSEENVKPSNFRRRRKLERKFKLKNEIESNDED